MRSANKLMKTVKSVLPFVLLVGLVYVAYTMYGKSSESFALPTDASGYIALAADWMSYPLVAAAVQSIKTYKDASNKIGVDVAASNKLMDKYIADWRKYRYDPARTATPKPTKAQMDVINKNTSGAQKIMDDYSNKVQKPLLKSRDDAVKLVHDAEAKLITAIKAASDAKKASDATKAKIDSYNRAKTSDFQFESGMPPMTYSANKTYRETIDKYKNKVTGTNSLAYYSRFPAAWTAFDKYQYFIALADSSPVVWDNPQKGEPCEGKPGKCHSKSFFLEAARAHVVDASGNRPLQYV